MMKVLQAAYKPNFVQRAASSIQNTCLTAALHTPRSRTRHQRLLPVITIQPRVHVKQGTSVQNSTKLQKQYYPIRQAKPSDDLLTLEIVFIYYWESTYQSSQNKTLFLTSSSFRVGLHHGSKKSPSSRIFQSMTLNGCRMLLFGQNLMSLRYHLKSDGYILDSYLNC